MPAVRVYVPLGRRGLLALVTEREVRATGDRPLTAYAVTSGLEAAHPGEGAEELEYLAFCDAAAAARALREPSSDRRVVVSADADAGWLVDGEGGRAAVALTTAIPLSRVASLHVDDVDAVAAGNESADEMLWYDATELDEVRALFG